MNLSLNQNGPAYLAVAIAIFGLVNTLVEISDDTQQAISVLIVAVAAALGIATQKNLTLPRQAQFASSVARRREERGDVGVIELLLIAILLLSFLTCAKVFAWI